MISKILSSEQLIDVVESYKNGELGGEAFIFYHSSWDNTSNRILKEIESNFSDSELNFFIVDTFEDPSMWKMFRPSATPALVILTETGPKMQLIPQMINITLDALNKKFVNS